VAARHYETMRLSDNFYKLATTDPKRCERSGVRSGSATSASPRAYRPGSPRQSPTDVMRVHQIRSYGPNVNTHHRTTDAPPGTSDARHDHSQHFRICPEGSTSGSIMVAVNGGPSGWPALDWAAAAACAHHSDLRIMHAISWPRWGLDPLGEPALDWGDTNAPDRGTLILEEAARRAHVWAPNATITTHLEAGDTAITIVRASRGNALIVVGHGRTRRPGGRSVARTVLRLAQCPIAIIRTSATSKPETDRR
jgi:nucleotide-binding universal stress UspA family protein